MSYFVVWLATSLLLPIFQHNVEKITLKWSQNVVFGEVRCMRTGRLQLGAERIIFAYNYAEGFYAVLHIFNPQSFCSELILYGIYEKLHFKLKKAGMLCFVTLKNFIKQQKNLHS